MKKIIVLVVFAVFTISGFAKEIEASLPDTTAVTFTQVYKDVKEGITSLALALKVPAEHVYQVLIKQQIVKAWMGILVAVFMFLLIFICIKFAFNIEDWDNGTVFEGKSPASLGLFIAFAFISLVFLTTFFAGDSFSNILQGFVNPEYGAIKDIMSFIK